MVMMNVIRSYMVVMYVTRSHIDVPDGGKLGNECD